MVQLLFIAAFLFVAFIAPLKTTLALASSLLLVVGLITLTARKLTGAPSSLGDAVRAVGLSFLFVVLAGLALFKFADLSGFRHFSGLSLGLVLGLFLLAYVLGFKLSLGLSLGASLIVALVAAVISTGLYWVTRSPDTAAEAVLRKRSETKALMSEAENYVTQKLSPALGQEMPRLAGLCPAGDADMNTRYRMAGRMGYDGRLTQVSLSPQNAYSECVARHLEQVTNWPRPECNCSIPVSFEFSVRRN